MVANQLHVHGVLGAADLLAFAKAASSLGNLDRLDLLLTELHEEVLLRVCSSKDILELLQVLVACHEGRAQVHRKDLCKLTVPIDNNFGELLIELAEEWLDQVKLLLALHEALHLLHEVLLGFLCVGVDNLCPQALFKISLRVQEVACLRNNFGFVSVVILKHDLAQSFFFFPCESVARIVGL